MAKNKFRIIIGTVCIVAIALVAWLMVDALAEEDHTDAEAYFDSGLACLQTAYEKGAAYAPEGIAALENAISDFTGAVELDPDYADAYYHRGVARIEFVHFYNKPFSQEIEQLFSDALSDFNKTIELDSKFYLAYAGMGNAYDRHGEFDEAVRWYDNALEHEDEILEHWGKEALADVYYSRGRAHGRTEDVQSIQDYETALEYNPNHENTLGHLAAVYTTIGEYQDALELYARSAAIKESKPTPGMWDFHYWEGRGICYYKMGEYQKATQDLNKALEVAYWPLTEAYLYLGKTYLMMGDEAKAEENLQTAITICSQKIEEAKPWEALFTEYNTRGLAYVELGECDKAISDFERVIELSPPFPYGHTNYFVDGHKNIGTAYSEMGDKEKAEQFYQEALSIAEERGLNFTKIEIEELLNEL